MIPEELLNTLSNRMLKPCEAIQYTCPDVDFDWAVVQEIVQWCHDHHRNYDVDSYADEGLRYIIVNGRPEFDKRHVAEELRAMMIKYQVRPMELIRILTRFREWPLK